LPATFGLEYVDEPLAQVFVHHFALRGLSATAITDADATASHRAEA